MKHPVTSIDDDPYGPLREALKEHRMMLRMSLRELARRMGCDNTWISDIERGIQSSRLNRVDPTNRTFADWCRALRLEPTIIIRIEELGIEVDVTPKAGGQPSSAPPPVSDPPS